MAQEAELMTGEAADQIRIGVEGHDDPAIGFKADGDTVAVVAVNERFQAITGGAGDLTDGDFGTDDSDSLDLDGLLTDCLADGAGRELAATVRAGERPEEPVRFDGDDTEYVPRVARTTAGGHVLFVPRPTDGIGVGSEEVAHVVSHDLRNPLDVAKAHLRVSQDEHDDEHLDKVAQAHERMEQIIQDVLTLARGEGTVDASDEVDLTSVVTTAWESVATADVSLGVESSLPTTTADRPRVERLVENLLRNAVEHAGTDPTVRAGGLPDDRGFYVADDGDGVPETEREAVFEPGYTDSDHGTGLGLAIVDRIASAHGWSVRFTDSRDGGARVEVWFAERVPAEADRIAVPGSDDTTASEDAESSVGASAESSAGGASGPDSAQPAEAAGGDGETTSDAGTAGEDAGLPGDAADGHDTDGATDGRSPGDRSPDCSTDQSPGTDGSACDSRRPSRESDISNGGTDDPPVTDERRRGRRRRPGDAGTRSHTDCGRSNGGEPGS